MSILLVLFHHFNIAYRLSDTTLARMLGWSLVHAVARNGNYGVTMFFTVSGFLITSNAQRRWGIGAVPLGAFYRLRAARILPCLLLLLAVSNTLAACGIAIFLNHPETGGPVPFWLVDLAALTFRMNVLMAHAGWLNYPLCVLWSLSVEEVFYLGFPVLCLLRRESRLALVLCGFVVAGPLWRLAHQDDESGFLYAYLANFDCVAIGCGAALLSRRLPSPPGWRVPAQAVTAACMAWLYLARSIGETNVWGVSLMALGTAMLLVASTRRPAEAPSGDGPVGAALRGCGRLSYELYLFHLVVLGGLQSVWPPASIHGDAKLVLLTAYLLLSLAVSACIGRIWSEPLNRLLRRAAPRDRALA